MAEEQTWTCITKLPEIELNKAETTMMFLTAHLLIYSTQGNTENETGEVALLAVPENSGTGAQPAGSTEPVEMSDKKQEEETKTT